VPTAEFSLTALAGAFAITGVVTANSLTVVDRDAERLVAVDPSALVARTVMSGWHRFAVDRAGHRHHAGAASMANLPPALSVSCS
jgi:hypothetical protein